MVLQKTPVHAVKVEHFRARVLALTGGRGTPPAIRRRCALGLKVAGAQTPRGAALSAGGAA